MKKAISLLLALVLCLCLCACAETQPDNEPDYETFCIGTWESNEYFAQSDGKRYKRIIDIYEGGTGWFQIYNVSDNAKGTSLPATWELNDDIINITWDGFSKQTEGYKIDFDNNSMKSVDGKYTLNKKEP